MVEAGIDDVDLADIRRLYSAVVALQAYHQAVASSYQSAIHRVEFNRKTIYADRFKKEDGSVEAKRQQALTRTPYLDVAATLADYQSMLSWNYGRADALATIGTFLSREMTARFQELASLKRDSD